MRSLSALLMHYNGCVGYLERALDREDDISVGPQPAPPLSAPAHFALHMIVPLSQVASYFCHTWKQIQLFIWFRIDQALEQSPEEELPIDNDSLDPPGS